MPARKTSAAALACAPLTPDRWDDLKTVFGPNGAFCGCWVEITRRRDDRPLMRLDLAAPEKKRRARRKSL